MMKRRSKELVFCLSLIVTIFCSQSSNATFMIIDDYLVYDTSNNLYFQRNYLAYNGLTFDQTLSAIEVSTVGGFTDWSLATRDQIYQSSFYEYENQNLPIEDMIDIFQIGADHSTPDYDYFEWEGLILEDIADSNPTTFLLTGVHYIASDMQHWDTMFVDRSYLPPEQELYSGVWAVSSGPSPVPEPTTMLLFGTGLIGLASSRLRRKKKS